MPVSATASRSSSAVSWVTWLGWQRDAVLGAAGELDAAVEALDVQPGDADAARSRAETAYQSQRRPTKSIDFLPV